MELTKQQKIIIISILSLIIVGLAIYIFFFRDDGGSGGGGSGAGYDIENAEIVPTTNDSTCKENNQFIGLKTNQNCYAGGDPIPNTCIVEGNTFKQKIDDNLKIVKVLGNGMGSNSEFFRIINLNGHQYIVGTGPLSKPSPDGWKASQYIGVCKEGLDTDDINKLYGKDITNYNLNKDSVITARTFMDNLDAYTFSSMVEACENSNECQGITCDNRGRKCRATDDTTYTLRKDDNYTSYIKKKN